MRRVVGLVAVLVALIGLRQPVVGALAGPNQVQRVYLPIAFNPRPTATPSVTVTATPTSTPLPATATLTSTPIPATATPTVTPVAGTATATPTPASAGSPTPTSSPVPLVWTQRASVPFWLDPVMGAASVNGQLYAVAPYDSIDGGDGNIHAATYDPSTDSWTMKPGFAPGSNCCGFFALAEATDGKLYLITAVPFQPLLTFRYDPSTDTWTTRASGPAGTSYFGWVAGSDGKLYAIGGNTSTNQPVTSLEVYDPSQDQWSSGPAMPLAVTSPTVVASSAGKLYVFSDGEEQIYDLASQSWTAMQVEALVTTGMGAAPASDGKLYLAGGPGCPCNGIPSSAVWTLDPGTNAWQMQTNLLWGRYQPAVAAVGSSLYVLGGWDGEGWDLAVEEAAIPPATSSGRSNRR